MTSIFFTLVVAAYGISGIISLFGYLPTVKDLWKGVPSANFYTYITWLIYYLISCLYGIFILKDWLFILVNGLLDSIFLVLIIILISRLQTHEIIADVKERKRKVVAHIQHKKIKVIRQIKEKRPKIVGSIKQKVKLLKR
ncbi:MAG: hypothetical protein PHU61_04055 [Candidatus Absconditabacteria bacterium]|nr:hypothetical protein [Candidatus Absconditabacteria bacterium]MDD3868341.1 hypothetical protein [Candidatus Absconditabacteria bacterium]MDD4714416.1 hypothetical protein [Candidatus Absconditabacteria bacterium]